MMNHWKKTIKLPILEISYEDIVTNTGETVRKLIEFCGLEWNDSCLSFYDNKRFTATASKNQVNKPTGQ